MLLADQPKYKYGEVKFLPLNEALQLQKHQKVLQDELYARQAAERLAQGFGIKMEEFKPEGHMSYRTSTLEDEASDVDGNETLEEPDDSE
ncbi:hypothetical protein ScPMuIL_018008 [Solemya velum]